MDTVYIYYNEPYWIILTEIQSIHFKFLFIRMELKIISASAVEYKLIVNWFLLAY